MSPAYTEEERRKKFFDDATTILYTPEGWNLSENGGLGGVTGKMILDLCSGDYVLAENVWNVCDWQHPATVLSALNVEIDSTSKEAIFKNADDDETEATITVKI